jgi:hypothetical protein
MNQKLHFGLLLSLFLALITCKDREVTNPFDTNCPKELFTPTDFKVEQEGTTVKLSWKQANTQISGFIISRNENDGAMIEVARTEKTVTSWSDQTIIGGKKYGYQLLAYAADNLSNPQKVSITPVTGAVVVTASTPSDLTPFSAVLGGNITGDGGATVTERGICYGTSQNPTTANSKVVVGNGTGEFSGSITSLTANTTYYARAYAINSQGTTYGNQITFSTPPLQLSVSPAIYDVPKESGSRVFTVTSNIEWQVVSDQTWCKPNITSGKGNSPVVATFEPNTAIGQRSALITFSAVGISNQTVVVTQAGTEPPVLTIAPENQNVTSTTTGTITFAITSNVSWKAESDQSWCTITNTTGVGNATLTINYEANTTNSQRVATVSVSGSGITAKIVTITQQSSLYNLNNNWLASDGHGLKIDGTIGVFNSFSSSWQKVANYGLVSIGSECLRSITPIDDSNWSCQALWWRTSTEAGFGDAYEIGWYSLSQISISKDGLSIILKSRNPWDNNSTESTKVFQRSK